MKVYTSDPWNWISAISVVTYFVGLGLQHGQTIQYYEAARIFRALNFMSFAYHLIRYMTALEMWGILIPVLHRMVSVVPRGAWTRDCEFHEGESSIAGLRKTRPKKS